MFRPMTEQDIHFAIADQNNISPVKDALAKVNELIATSAEGADITPEDMALITQTALAAIHGDGLDDEAAEVEEECAIG